MGQWISLLVFICGSWATASTGLTVYTEELGVAKFHRFDHKVHPYSANNSWAAFVLPENAGTDKTLVQKNVDQSYTIFFLTLEDMVTAVAQISQTENKPVNLLSIHGHGLPGAMWFPKDAGDLSSGACDSWKTAASGSDQDNYDQYYSPVSLFDIQQIRQMSQNTNNQMGCTTGLSEWQDVISRHPEFLKALAPDAQLNFLSCVVGLGHAGDVFATGLSQLLFQNNATARIQTSVNLGLGDWSMEEGMGFWDYLTDAQLNHDNEVYPKNRRDREVAQKGSIRATKYDGTNGWVSGLITNQDFLIFNKMTKLDSHFAPEVFANSTQVDRSTQFVRIPGTRMSIEVRH